VDDLAGRNAAPLDAALDLAACGIPTLPAHIPAPILGQGLAGCSCGRVACPTPARHPMGKLGPRDATTDAQMLCYWWGAGGAWRMANVATVAGHAVEVVELLGYPPHWSEIADWLSAHQAGNGPVLGVDQGTVRFLGSPRRSGRARSTRLAVGWVRRLGRGEVVLLPPSRLPGDSEVSWLTGPHMPLPDGKRLLEALTRLPPPEELILWAKQRDHAATE
jgi:Bifunctional DNA primase/polymerase, N-terminal